MLGLGSYSQFCFLILIGLQIWDIEYIKCDKALHGDYKYITIIYLQINEQIIKKRL